MAREIVIGLVLVALLGAVGLAVFIWYLNISGLYDVIRDSVRRRGKGA